jgi:hypothetical protein
MVSEHANFSSVQNGRLGFSDRGSETGACDILFCRKTAHALKLTELKDACRRTGRTRPFSDHGGGTPIGLSRMADWKSFWCGGSVSAMETTIDAADADYDECLTLAEVHQLAADSDLPVDRNQHAELARLWREAARKKRLH